MKGNSTLHPNEFFVHPPPDDPHNITPGHIYQHLPDGTLQYYQFINKESQPGLIAKSGLPITQTRTKGPYFSLPQHALPNVQRIKKNTNVLNR